MLFIPHRTFNSFTSNSFHDYPAAVPLVICNATPETMMLAAEVAAPLLQSPTVTVPEVTAEIYAVKTLDRLDTVTRGATLNLDAGNATAVVAEALAAKVATCVKVKAAEANGNFVKFPFKSDAVRTSPIVQVFVPAIIYLLNPYFTMPKYLCLKHPRKSSQV
jgi:hypothetical protein